jgi:hypothetical protein
MTANLPASATSPESPSVLPEAWIEKLFQRFEDYYGAKWAAQYGSFPRERVKRTWAEELAGFAAKPECITSALSAQKSSPFPPTLPEFLGLCREALRRIGDDVKPMLTHKVDHARQAEFAAKLKGLVSNLNRGSDPIFWATHPRSHLALKYIQGAAKNDPERFQPCIDKLVADGVVSADGHLIHKYAGNGSWEKA